MDSDPQPAQDAAMDAAAEGERLQKVLAAAGVASRRVCEEYIVQGRIRVNGEQVTELGRRVDPAVDVIEVDGTVVALDASRRYLMLNKPTGVVSSMRDEQGRPDLRQYTGGFEERLYNVGRLDSETSGLLILTNDGELAHVLAHPSFGVQKTYLALVSGTLVQATLRTLLEGIELEDGFIQADAARVVDYENSPKPRTLVELTLHSGRNRIVRRMLAAVGHPVLELVRRQFGPLHLGSLKLGQTRELNRTELGQLLTLVRSEGSRSGAPAAPGAQPRKQLSSKQRYGGQAQPRQERGAGRGEARGGKPSAGNQSSGQGGKPGGRPGRDDRGGAAGRARGRGRGRGGR